MEACEGSENVAYDDLMRVFSRVMPKQSSIRAQLPQDSFSK